MDGIVCLNTCISCTTHEAHSLETKSHLCLAKDLGYLKDAEVTAIFDLIKDLGVRLNNTISALSQQQSERQG